MPDPYFSEIKYLGGPTLDFIEVAVDAGSSVANLVVTIYNSNGSIRSSNSLAGLPHTTIAGRDVYVIESGSPGSFSGLAKHNGLALSDGATVYDFVSFTDNAASVTATAGPANGLTSREIGQAGSGQSLETTDGGANYGLQTAPNSGTIPCLSGGTHVETVDGAVLVEDLRAGMKLRTLDGSYAILRKVLSKKLSARKIEENSKLAPVRIMAGALGIGLPHRDLLVSRQHRMLVTSPITKRMFAQADVLVAAVHMTVLPGIFVEPTAREITYFHLVFDAHCVIFAEGAPTESLYLGPQAKAALPRATLNELKALFPDLQAKTMPAPAAFIPKAKQQKQLLARHEKNARAVLSQMSLRP